MRALVAALDSVTVGVLIQEVLHPASAYIALLATALYLVGVLLLPHRRTPPGDALARWAEPAVARRDDGAL